MKNRVVLTIVFMVFFAFVKTSSPIEKVVLNQQNAKNQIKTEFIRISDSEKPATDFVFYFEITQLINYLKTGRNTIQVLAEPIGKSPTTTATKFWHNCTATIQMVILTLPLTITLL